MIIYAVMRNVFSGGCLNTNYFKFFYTKEGAEECRDHFNAGNESVYVHYTVEAVEVGE